MRIRITTAVLAGLGLACLASATRAQSTIPVLLSNIYHSEGVGPGGGRPFWRASLTNDPDPAPYLGHVEDIQSASYFEYKVSCNTPGLYNVEVVCFEPSDPHMELQFETRPFTLNDDPTVTHYATQNSKDYGQFGTWGSAGVPRVYSDLNPVVAADGTTALTVPLWAGDNIVRVRNIANRHHAPVSGYPIVGSDLGRLDLRELTVSNTGWSNLHVAAVTLNRVGDLPAMGTITGTVTADVPAGLPVRSALVLANPPGASPPEIASWWNWGYYTYSKKDGTYSLQAPVGSRDIKAGRPSGYLPTGSTVSNVTVPGTGTVTANITLPSLWFKDGSGDWNAFPQAEYFDAKNDNISLVPSPGENGFRMAWSWAVKKVYLIVDVPVSGNYEFTDSFTSGDGADQTMRLSSNLGPYTDVVQVSATLPPAGWENPVTATAPNSIYLAQGTQTLTLGLLNGNCDFDGFQLRQLHTPVTLGVVQGTITDSLTGKPVVGATVSFAGISVTTDENGNYKGVGPLGTAQTFTVSSPLQDAGYAGTVDVVSTATTVKNASLPIRPNIALSTANGYAFKAILNTGDAADYSAVSADESGMSPYIVPGSWDSISATDDIYGWIRVHFTLPANFLTLIPGRAVRFHVSGGGIDDVDKTYLNGTVIGSAGSFPNPALPIQPAGHTNRGTQTYDVSYPGLDQSWGEERIYTFPASLLTTGDNVLAIKCFDLTAAGGLIGNAAIEIAPPTGAVNGTVKVGGNPVAGARVAVSNANGISSAWGWTDATGAFSLPYAAAGPGVLGVTKLGVNAIVQPVMVPTNGALTFNLTPTAVAAPYSAPLYDNFDDNAGAPTWQNKWWPVALENNSDPLNTPTVVQPGYDISSGGTVTIPSTVTVKQLASGHRNSIVSKDRFSRFASTNEAKLVSAKGPVTASDDWGWNTILNLHGNSAVDPTVPTPNIFNPEVELDIEGWRSNGTTNIVQWIVWDTNGRRSNGIVPFTLAQMADITTANPMVLAINRTGSVYDFFINGTLVHSEQDPISMPDHRIALYGYQLVAENTWDWVSGGPIASTTTVKGDVNSNAILDYEDVVNALRIAGGLSTSTPAQITAGNQAGGDAIISVLDAVRIDQALGGKAL
ncbi:MAG TPA: hypothetical protein VGM51_05840 [Armatimonadota bacterium]